MSKIFDLINELCPDGVEFRELGALVEISNTGVDKKKNEHEKEVRLLNFVDVFRNQYINNSTPTMIVTASDRKIIDCSIEKGDVFITPSSEILDEIGYSAMATENIDNAVYSYHIMRLRIFDFNILSPSYLNYIFSSSGIRNQIRKNAQGITRFGLTLPKWKSIKLPVPPMEVQREIVRILDSFTLLTAELTAELTARKKQYEFYRDFLLSFDELDKNGGGCELKMLGEIADYSSSRISFSALNELNYVSVENLLQDKAGKIPSKCVPSSGNWTKFESGDILIGNIRPYLKKIWQADCIGGASGDVLVLHLKDTSVNFRYLYQILADDKFFNYDMKNAKGAKMPRGNKDLILEYKIPVPSLQTQQKVVEILDKFDTLVNSITEGLPREIELRRKQYEHYRELLLNFKPKMRA